ncbi:helix-turn-helix domain-containing protein [Streptomyces sp. NPDC047046]|uniref:helix-turn-helix domain-containing protein n=1 Tax=Streptomyces sp. NPDC047046 TaxID=3155378 RepID=UPI0033EA65AC
MEDTSRWEIARVRARGGVAMAGFRVPPGSDVELRALPHPAVTLAVEFGERAFEVRAESGDIRAQSGEVRAASGEVRAASGEVRAGGLAAGLGFGVFRARAAGTAAVQARLSPLLARSVLGVPLGELGRGVVPLDAVWGAGAERLRERLAEAAGWPERFALVEAELARRAQAEGGVDPEVAHVWRLIVRGGGRVRVEELAGLTGWSRQRLWARFGEQLGITPKRAAMLVRFDHAVHALLRGDGPARVAAEHGYADQSHLHRDVRLFAGTTPGLAIREPWLAVDDRAWPTRGT